MGAVKVSAGPSLPAPAGARGDSLPLLAAALAVVVVEAF